MNAIRLETTIGEALAQAIPALRPLLGKRVELIALQTDGENDERTSQKLSFDELLAGRVNAPPGAPRLSEHDIERAIVTGALDGNA